MQPFYASGSAPLVIPFSSCLEVTTKNFIAKYLIKKPIQEISEFEWMTHFKECEIAERKDLAVLDAKMAKLKMNMALGDASSMVDSVSLEICRIAEDTGLLKYVEENDPKRMVKYLVNTLEPPAFKQRIEAFLLLDSYKSYKKDFARAHGWIREDLKNFLEYTPVVAAPKKFETKRESSSGARRQGNHGAQEKRASQREESGNRGHRGEFACFKCGSRNHDVFLCHQTKVGEAESLLKAFKEKRADRW
jgi:hypothetical protein